ncbi:MAG: VOC family protein [Burkholderiales bacterium]|nr:VOC family protein [Burkholderiales bacterium]
MTLALDHLVLAARTLDEGVAWCEATLGLRPEAGGQHVFMGTHNRVFGIASSAFPRSYFEIIAIDPSLPAPKRARWFGLDEPPLQAALADGPRLVSWVARCNGIEATRLTLRAAGIDCGVVEAAERATPRGLLRWKISLRADGHRLLGGAAPALIEWGDVHPTDAMPASGIELQTMRLGRWPDSLAPLLPPQIERDRSPSAPPISVVLSSPRGLVTLNSHPTEA